MWLLNNWEYVLLVLFIIEKIVLISPSKWDDLIVSAIKAGLMKFFKDKDK